MPARTASVHSRHKTKSSIVESGWKTVAKKSLWQGLKPQESPESTPRNAEPSSHLAARAKEYHSPNNRTEQDSRWPSDREEDADDHGDGSDQFDTEDLSVEYITMTPMRLS